MHWLDRGVDDGLEGGVQLEAGGHHQHGLDQAVQPVAALDDLLHPVLDLDEELAQT